MGVVVRGHSTELLNSYKHYYFIKLCKESFTDISNISLKVRAGITTYVPVHYPQSECYIECVASVA